VDATNNREQGNHIAGQQQHHHWRAGTAQPQASRVKEASRWTDTRRWAPRCWAGWRSCATRTSWWTAC
jgi:hypothetical protein